MCQSAGPNGTLSVPNNDNIAVYLQRLLDTVFQMSRNRIVFLDGKPANYMDNKADKNLFGTGPKWDPSNLNVLAVDLDYTGARRLTDLDNCPRIENDKSVNFVWAYNMLFMGCWLRFEGVSYDDVIRKMWYTDDIKNAIGKMIDYTQQDHRIQQFLNASTWRENARLTSKRNVGKEVVAKNTHDMTTVGMAARFYVEHYLLVGMLKDYEDNDRFMKDLKTYADQKHPASWKMYAKHYSTRIRPMVFLMKHINMHITYKSDTSVIYMMQEYMNLTDDDLQQKFQNSVVTEAEIIQMLQNWQHTSQDDKQAFANKMLGNLKLSET